MSTENVPYEATEEYTVKEPYSYTETYYEEIPYLDEGCEYRLPSYNYEQDAEWVDGKLKVICTISNFENEDVRFQYILYTSDCEGNYVDTYGTRIVTIGAGETVKKEAILEPGGCYKGYAYPYNIEDCKSVTKFKSVRKERTVTKYQDVIKTRSVTKIRVDTIYTQVNWLFGVKMPWLAEWREEGEVKWYYPVE